MSIIINRKACNVCVFLYFKLWFLFCLLFELLCCEQSLFLTLRSHHSFPFPVKYSTIFIIYVQIYHLLFSLFTFSFNKTLQTISFDQQKKNIPQNSHQQQPNRPMPSMQRRRKSCWNKGNYQEISIPICMSTPITLRIAPLKFVRFYGALPSRA